jgi:iron complex transport system permease protein
MIALAFGSEQIAFDIILRIIGYEITGYTTDATAEQVAIITDIRLPRVLMAIVVGAALSVAGAAFQALLRNPLADPGILGISAGAALGASAATIFAETIPVSRPIAAFVSAFFTMGAVYAIGRGRRGASTDRLILAGVIVNAFLSSSTIYLVAAASGSRFRNIFSWLLGDLGGEPGLLPIVAPLVAFGIFIIFINSRSLNLMMTGEEEALALGVEVKRVRISVYVAASLVTGAAVAVGGAIGFVGLIIPHAVRLAGGSDNRLVVPGSALGGAAFLLFADTLARTLIAPRELHIGVITALIGAPAFVYLLRRTS